MLKLPSQAIRVAYADPPYLGQGARLYSEHHAQAEDWDQPATHRALIESLVTEFPDGWALSCSTPSLAVLLPMCPADVRIGAWFKTFCAFKKGIRPCYAWEPVIFRGGRNSKPPAPPKGGTQTTPKDFCEINEPALGIAARIAFLKGLPGAKPPAVCRWILDLLNVQPGDVVVDLFPGTGAMTRIAHEVTAEHFDLQPTHEPASSSARSSRKS